MQPTNLEQTQRLGDYLILGLLGEGGMGRVYEAEEHLSKRRVALKILHSELTQSREGRRQFVNEMAILSSLDDPHIVRCLHCTEIDGQLVMVLEHLDGQTLRAVLKQRGRVPWNEVVQVIAQVAQALRTAHSRAPAIIHRDLKPENVMWLNDGRVKVMDFGIAKILSTMGATTNQAFGTLQYMSPEQIDALPLGPASDLYALGLLMWELLAGHPPFAADSPRVLLEMLCNTPAPPLPEAVRPGMPVELQQLISHLLEKVPERRPQTADAVLDVLRRVQAPVPADIDAPRVAEGETQRPEPTVPQRTASATELDTVAIVERASSSPNRRVMATTVAVGVVLCVWVGVGVWAFGGDTTAPGLADAMSRGDAAPKPTGQVDATRELAASEDLDLNALDTAKIETATRSIDNLSSSVEMYRLLKGRCPKTIQDLESAGIVAKVTKDPWGNDYAIECPGQHGAVDISSNGADGVAGTEDDINSWDKGGGVKSAAADFTKARATKGPFSSLVRYCGIEVENLEFEICGLRAGPGAASRDMRGLGTVSAIYRGDAAFGGTLGLAFVRPDEVYIVEELANDGGGSEVFDEIVSSTITSDAGTALVTFVLNHHERVYVDDSRAGVEQGGASWTRIVAVRCRAGSDGRPVCAEPVERQEARGHPTTPEVEVWRAFVDDAIAHLKIPRYAGPPLLHGAFEFDLEVCKDGRIESVIPTGSSKHIEAAVLKSELERMKVPVPPPGVAQTMAGDCGVFESFSWVVSRGGLG